MNFLVLQFVSYKRTKRVLSHVFDFAYSAPLKRLYNAVCCQSRKRAKTFEIKQRQGYSGNSLLISAVQQNKKKFLRLVRILLGLSGRSGFDGNMRIDNR